MDVIKVSAMPNGTKIQIEDWSEDFDFFAPSSTLAAYPISKNTLTIQQKLNVSIRR